MNFIVINIVILMLISIISSLIIHLKKSGDIFNPWTIITSISILDVYIPALLRVSNDSFNKYPSWMTFLSEGDLAKGVVFYYFGWVLFSIAYFLTSRSKKSSESGYNINLNRMLLGLTLCIVFYFCYFLAIYQVYGGFDTYLKVALSERFRNNYELSDYLIRLEFFRSFVLSLIFIIVANLFWNKESVKRFGNFRYLFLLLGIAISFTTLFRGTVLNFVFGFGALSVFYFQSYGNSKLKLIKGSVRLVIFVVALFLVVGGVRSLYISSQIHEASSAEFSLLNEINKNLTGSSLLGVSSIIKFYEKPNEDHLYGKTIYDMLLMPVPRFIYTSKPEWYGIDDIGKQMGWPSSTQTAVSPPGEYYANFGYFGIVIMLLLGGFFGALSSWAKNNTVNASIYAFIVIPSTFTTFWMSTTGLVNAIKFLPFLYIAVSMLFYKRKDN